MYDLTRLESFNDVRIWIEGEPISFRLASYQIC